MTTRIARRGLVGLVGLGLVVTVGPWLWSASPTTIDLGNIGAGPSVAHPLGTDETGRDVLSRLLGGGRVTLLVALLAMATAVSLGSLIGGIAGFRGGRVEAALMRGVDAALAVPGLFIAICLLAFAGPGIPSVILAIGLTTWMPTARVVRGEVARVRREPYIEAAAALGATSSRILWHHVRPLVVPLLLVAATLAVATAILTEAALSFLGIGIQPPTPSWGNMLSGAQGTLSSYPWLAILPGLLIVAAVASVNAAADALRSTHADLSP
ncbi:MAG: ABC transporter permease [Gemmatimonadetes bacterium]|nr:ABC transporter permease [Gemmatimonadota bacterium]